VSLGWPRTCSSIYAGVTQVPTSPEVFAACDCGWDLEAESQWAEWARRQKWFLDYMKAIIQRDVRQIYCSHAPAPVHERTEASR